MATSDVLNTFVKEGLGRGVPRRDLEIALVEAGWRPADTRAALAAFADVSFPIPVPRPRPNLSARDAFLYLLLFGTLYIVAINLGSLCFRLIDQFVPDPAYSPPAAMVRDMVRWSVSALVVATPVFLFVSALTGREARLDPAKRTSLVRRWLTYMTLFVAASVLIGDVTALVYHLLGGELVLRFTLKALVVAALAGSAFLYYLADLRRDEREAA